MSEKSRQVVARFLQMSTQEQQTFLRKKKRREALVEFMLTVAFHFAAQQVQAAQASADLKERHEIEILGYQSQLERYFQEADKIADEMNHLRNENDRLNELIKTLTSSRLILESMMALAYQLRQHDVVLASHGLSFSSVTGSKEV